MSNYAKRLAGLKKQWSEDKPHTGGGQLPEGKYQFIIKRALIEESKADFNKGNMTIVIHLEVVTGENKGRKHIYRLDLEAKANAEKGWPSGISRFKGLLDILHIEIPGSFDDAAMNEILKAMLNLVVAGQCVHNQKGYANVYINSLIDAPVDSEDDEEEAEEEDSDEDEDSEDEESDDEEDDDEEDEEEEEEKPKKPAAKPAPTKAATTTAAKAAPSKPAKKGEDDDDWSL